MRSPGRTHAPRWPHLAILAVTIIAGLVAVFTAQEFFTHSVRSGLSDEYDEIALNLTRHGTYSANRTDWDRPTVTRGPVYPLYLAGLFRLFGEGNTTAVHVFDVLLYALTAMLLVAVLQHFMGPLPAFLGGLLFVFWPTSFYYAVKGSSETILTLWLVAALLALVGFREKPGVRGAIVLGLCLGLSTLSRGSAVVLLAVVTAWLVTEAVRRRVPVRLVVVVLLAWGLVMSPWWARNYRVSGQFVPFHSLTWYNAYHDDVFDSARDWLAKTGRSGTDWGTVDPTQFPDSLPRHPEGFQYPSRLSAPDDLEQEARYRGIMLGKYRDVGYLLRKLGRNAVDFWSAAASVRKSRILLVTSIVWVGLFALSLWRIRRRDGFRWLALVCLAVVMLTWGLYLPFMAIFRHSVPLAPFIAAVIAMAIGTLVADGARTGFSETESSSG